MFTQFFSKAKDGGSKSPVDGYFLFELKSLCSVVLLKFNKGSRENFHNHAFHAMTWFIKGEMVEEDVSGSKLKYKFSLKPKITMREKCHRVIALEDSWCISIRGPWSKNWKEFNKQTNETTILTNGRKVVEVKKENV